MTDERFQEQAVNLDLGTIVQVIREMSFARRAVPVRTDARIEDLIATYYKVKEEDNTQVNHDLVAPDYSGFATEKVQPTVPVIQGNLAYSRLEYKRALRDVFPFDQRQQNVIAQMVDREEKLFWGGHATTGITSWSTTGTNSTAAADELDLGTFIEATQHFHASVSQLRNLLKNQFQGTKLTIGWTTDVDDRARALMETYNEGRSFYDWLVDYLGKFNGGNGNDYIFPTNYLGSEAGTGTTNMVMIANDRRHVELLSSPIDHYTGETALGGVEVELAWRSRPLFYSAEKTAIYHGTVVLTP